MTQPQAATPAPEKPAFRGAGLKVPGPELLGRAREGGIIYPFLILFVVLAIWKGQTFYGQTNLLEILDQQSATLIIAAAGTMVLIGGGIDLSVGATYALCQVIAMKMAITGNPVLAILVGVVIGIGVGAANGVITTFFRINSLIATLATSFVITGGAALITGGNLITNFSATGFADFARTQFLDVTTAAWTMIGVVIVLGIVLSRTIAGRYMYAAGSNAEAARLAGVLFIALIGNGFTLLGWNPLYEQITLGVILLLAVAGDAWSRLRTA
ncbi:MAG TPA: ABC transporter permease [Trebonia sp.]|nr:ABC transporter permease [Trebonia sp.]